MEWSKLKNIIILMLAAVNVMLLVLVLSRQWESRSYSENAREDAVAILWETGRIRVERDALPDEMDLPVLTVTRDPELELRQAEALLGALSGEPSSMRYEGERGTAQFYANGGFSAELEAGACPIGDKAPAAYAVDLLGLELHPGQTNLSVRTARLCKRPGRNKRDRRCRRCGTSCGGAGRACTRPWSG